LTARPVQPDGDLICGASPGCASADTGVVHWSATPAAPGT